MLSATLVEHRGNYSCEAMFLLQEGIASLITKSSPSPFELADICYKTGDLSIFRIGLKLLLKGCALPEQQDRALSLLDKASAKKPLGALSLFLEFYPEFGNDAGAAIPVFVKIMEGINDPAGYRSDIPLLRSMVSQTVEPRLKSLDSKLLIKIAKLLKKIDDSMVDKFILNVWKAVASGGPEAIGQILVYAHGR